MQLKLRFAALGVATSLLLLFAFAPAASAASAAKKTANTLSTPISGTVAEGTSTQTLTGTFNISHFVNQNGAIWAVGTLKHVKVGKTHMPDAPLAVPVTAINGTPIGGSSSAATTNAAAAADPSCSVLSLTLGPLHLNLLGLVVDLNQVNLNITAVQGPGNLLGNLLCAVAGLLNPGAGGLNLTAITNLLNQILGAL